MDKRSKALFNDQILAQSAKLFRANVGQMKDLGGFESFIYEFMLDGAEFIMRITHSLHRDKGEMQAEVDWIYFLAQQGVSVAKPIFSVNERLLERIDLDDSYFLVSAFEKAPGGKVTKENWNEDLFIEWGKITGQMHKHTQSYEPPTGLKRPMWYEDPLLLEAENHLPAGHEIVVKKFSETIQKIKELPQNSDAFGLIHTDLHYGNFFVHEGKITAFDFDDCSYQYFVSDIAIPLFYSLYGSLSGDDKISFTRIFMKNFLAGYLTEHCLDKFWLEQLPLFLKLREIELYVVYHRSLDIEKLSDAEKQRLIVTKSNIENDIPYMNLSLQDLGVHD
ncbi:phosphotransferase enzyme family protein [Bacillus horti]|uniref:Ser/Thr protein kinase RdoA (MazF antagonist) n=1 Tax=Caldalkalibacillus horti TaxID=77523 RepID=A0ABT9W541_9BACI|nr:phosphotransferase [Bacillus horti]MDQ0168355.1 Ser/Thr protein kinase RdoA (MazF antagonist) [Bacillus horti]